MKTSPGRTIAPVMIIVLVTLAALLLYFSVYSAVQNRFQLLYVEVPEHGAYAVSGCSKSTDELVIPATYQGSPVQYILKGSFSNMSIRTLTLEAVTDIGELAFRNCQSLTGIRLGKTEVIGDNAFEFCRSLVQITIPETVRQIGKHAFSFCSLLEEVYFLSDPENLGESIFEFSPKVVIYGIPGGNVEAYCAEYGLEFHPLPEEVKTGAVNETAPV